MSDITLGTAVAGVPEAAPRRPPVLTTGPVAWLRANLFSSWLNTAVTLVLGYLIVRYAISFIDWAFLNAIWSVPNNQTQACRALKASENPGACWAVITEKHRFILFGTYPYEQHWRPGLVILLFTGLYVVSAMRRFWRKELVLIWAAVLTSIAVLMWGGDTAPPLPGWPILLGLLVAAVVWAALSRSHASAFPIAAAAGVLVVLGQMLAFAREVLDLGFAIDLGPFLVAMPAPWPQLLFGALLAAVAFLYSQGRVGIAPVAIAIVLFGMSFGTLLGLPYVPQERWGGLPITLILATFGLAFAFPLAILVALGRRSKMPAIRLLCVVYVELIRGVPLISLLFMASVMFPLFLPEGMNIDKLLRAQVAVILFAGAYLAEVVRGGLQALPRGQYEAADALGLSYWQKTGFIILPQALRLVIPPLVNTFIGFFKDTSLVLIIGIFDLLTAGKTAIVEPAWQGFGVEVYLAISVVYFIYCFAMSRYSQNLEAELNRHRAR